MFQVKVFIKIILTVGKNVDISMIEKAEETTAPLKFHILTYSYYVYKYNLRNILVFVDNFII